MTDHATEAERFRNEYLRLRTPGRVPKLADVLALANYHATMAVVDAVRGLAPKPVPLQTFASRWPNGKPDPCNACWQRHDPGPCPNPEEQRAAWAKVREALQEATGSPQNDEQPEPGQVDGGEATQCSHFHRADDEVIWKRHAADNLLDRAEKAEAERDAILDELRAFIPTMPAGIMASLDYPRNEIQAIIDRHAPEG